MEQTKVNADRFIKDYNEQRNRAFQIIKTLKAKSKIESVNFYLKTEIIIIDGTIKTKCTIEEYPIVRFTKNTNSDNQNNYYKDIVLRNIGEELKI